MLTRSNSSAVESCVERRSSLPSILTRGRKRKSSSFESVPVSGLYHPINENLNREQYALRETREARRRSERVPKSTLYGQTLASSRASNYEEQFDPGEGRYPKSSSDEDSVLSGLSIEDSLSGRSTPPLSSISRSSVSSQTSSDLNVHCPPRHYKINVRKASSATLARPSPLPPVTFARSSELWELMCASDEKYIKRKDIFANHPALGPQMRAILIDWLMDVCEAYNLHRETLYLAIDYLDRYLASERNILKNHLQLIGIACLFLASKIEEIYPPKLSVFAYVTDGACSDEDITEMEIVITTALKWKLTPITSCSWTNLYLQVLSSTGADNSQKCDFLRSRSLRKNTKLETIDTTLVKPAYDPVDFVRAIRIVDLVMLDMKSLNYSYSMLAAAALYHTKGRMAALRVSGFGWEELSECVFWMSPYAAAASKEAVPEVLPIITGVCDESRHLIQSHCVNLRMLEHAQLLSEGNKKCSPMTKSDGLLTPPHSREKYRRRKRQ